MKNTQLYWTCNLQMPNLNKQPFVKIYHLRWSILPWILTTYFGWYEVFWFCTKLSWVSKNYVCGDDLVPGCSILAGLTDKAFVTFYRYAEQLYIRRSSYWISRNHTKKVQRAQMTFLSFYNTKIWKSKTQLIIEEMPCLCVVLISPML